MQGSNFRNWLNIIWRENCREYEDFGQMPYNLQEYWHRYKYWLKREYRYQMLQKVNKSNT